MDGNFESSFWFEDKINWRFVWFELDEPTEGSIFKNNKHYIICTYDKHLDKYFDNQCDRLFFRWKRIRKTKKVYKVHNTID